LILCSKEGSFAQAASIRNKMAEDPKYFNTKQFSNPLNVECHELTTGKEILEQTKEIDAFVAGVGTGGTVTGVGEVLKKELGDVKVIAVEPMNSAVLSGEKAGSHSIQGIGAGFVPDVVNMKFIDEVIKVSDEEAFDTARKIIKQEGILCGISSGANFFAAAQVARRLGKGRKVVTVFPDTGERYLSTKLFYSDDTRYEGI